MSLRNIILYDGGYNDPIKMFQSIEITMRNQGLLEYSEQWHTGFAIETEVFYFVCWKSGRSFDGQTERAQISTRITLWIKWNTRRRKKKHVRRARNRDWARTQLWQDGSNFSILLGLPFNQNDSISCFSCVHLKSICFFLGARCGSRRRHFYLRLSFSRRLRWFKLMNDKPKSQFLFAAAFYVLFSFF